MTTHDRTHTPAAAPPNGKLLEGRPSPDDLQWLESTHGEAALRWARAATQESAQALRALPQFDSLLQDIVKVNRDTGQSADIGIAGARALRLAKTGLHPKGLLQAAPWDGEAIGPWTTLLDVGAWAEGLGKDFDLHWSMTCVSPNGERCLLPFHEANGDEAEMHEFDLATARFVADGFALPKSRIVFAWIDDDTLLVGHTANDAPKAPGGWPAEALVWRRGTPVSDAKSVLRMGANDSLFLPMQAGGRGMAVIAQLIDYSTAHLHCVTAAAGIRTLPLPTALKLVFGANADHAFVQLSAPATLDGRELAADSILAVPLAGDEAPVEVVLEPRDGEVVDTFLAFHATRSSLALPVRSGLSLRVDIARRQQGGWHVAPLVGNSPGAAPRITAAGLDVDGFVIAREGFLFPPTQEWVTADGARTILESMSSPLDTSSLHLEQRQAMSRDGQVVDYVLIGPRARDEKPVPTLMTGYGTSGVSLTPAHMSSPSGAVYGGASLKPWFQRGGALAVPVLRGGGEHGVAWHHAGRRDRKQNSYDDFHAVAESLIASGYTRRDRLGVFGSSAGGLLAAVAGTQRPDLYGAVVVDTPVTDMLRYPTMGIGANLIDEFGDPNEPAAAAWLVKYSPFHNIHAGTDYPAFLVTIATTDNRVGPGHARKFAMRLRDSGVPTLFLESEAGGHGVSDSLQRPEFMAMRTAFFVSRLVPGEAA